MNFKKVVLENISIFGVGDIKGKKQTRRNPPLSRDLL